MRIVNLRIWNLSSLLKLMEVLVIMREGEGAEKGASQLGEGALELLDDERAVHVA